jgi:hypothetical protein
MFATVSMVNQSRRRVRRLHFPEKKIDDQHAALWMPSTGRIGSNQVGSGR